MDKQGIRNQIKGLLARNDTTNSIIDGFIDQSIARIQRSLRVPPMEKSDITTVTEENAGAIILPNDFMRLKHLFTLNLPRNYSIQYVDPSTFMQTQDAPGNTPKIYTRIQGSLLIKPTPPVGTQLQLVYYGEIPDLIDDADTNFITELAPDLLIYTALSFASDYYIDDRKDQFEAVAQRAYEELKAQGDETELMQEGLVISTSFNAPEY
jgi:hypothetical protein